MVELLMATDEADKSMPTDATGPVDLIIHGVTAVDAGGLRRNRWIAVTAGVIRATGTDDGWRQLAVAGGGQTRDGAGLHLTPGLIDVHTHGGSGHAHDDGVDAIEAALRCHRPHGTTRSVVSVVTNPLDRMAAALRAVGEVMRSDPTVLGSHAEGPFLHPDRRGAHVREHLAEPDPTSVDALLEAAAGRLCQVTIAPELPGAFDAITRFREAGVTVAVGHTDADVDMARRAFDAGARVLTHAFNGMRPMHHRAPGPVVAALNDPRISLELIPDGHHVHPEMIRMTFLAAPSRVLLITDAMAAACCGDGDYRLGETDVVVRDGRATVAGSDGLAGSTLTQDRALRFAIQRCGIDPVHAVEAATLTPARMVGCDDRFGRLQPGFVADLVLFDADWQVREVWIDGASTTRCAP
jgi:N-acetylglucosamine-6-phosphate deacetylase